MFSAVFINMSKWHYYECCFTCSFSLLLLDQHFSYASHFLFFSNQILFLNCGKSSKPTGTCKATFMRMPFTQIYEDS